MHIPEIVREKDLKGLNCLSVEKLRLVNTPSLPRDRLKRPSLLLRNLWQLIAAGREETELFFFSCVASRKSLVNNLKTVFMQGTLSENSRS